MILDIAKRLISKDNLKSGSSIVGYAAGATAVGLQAVPDNEYTVLVQLALGLIGAYFFYSKK